MSAARSAGESWRPMRQDDLPAVMEIASICHPNYPERLDIFAERLALAPSGSWLLEADGVALGYGVMHPARRFSPPALDSLLGALPDLAEVWYMHDIALLPMARGGGAASRLTAIAAREARRTGLERLALVAVNGSAPFWARRGFLRVQHPSLAGLLASYGLDAVYLEKPA